MTEPVVFGEKLRRPDSLGLGRARLEAPLLRPAAQTRLTVVTGPPGSGKTTLLSHVAAASTAPVAWYRLTADDATEASLVAYLARALREALGLSVQARTMPELLGALDGAPSAMLIFDDVHEIAGSSAERALERFIALRPHALAVILGSRRLPEVNIPRLRVSGVLREITGDDLRFRSWEVEELFVSVFREPLTPESAASLTRRTGGWAAGLQLFHLATRGRSAPDRHRAVAELSGKSRLLRSYLARNVVADLPPDRREFLVKTSSLGVLTGPLCDALLGTTGSGTVLEELEQLQLFCSSEDDGATFRYHEVLRTHLQWALLEELGAERARSWYSRSAALLEAAGLPRAAIRASVKAEDWGAVARLQQQLLRETGGSGLEDPLEHPLPRTVVADDPWLSLADARRLLRSGALADAITVFQQAESLFDEPAFREQCRRERMVAQLWSPGDVGWVGDGRPGGQHWSAGLRAVVRNGPPRNSFPATTNPADPAVRLATAIGALAGGDFEPADHLLGAVGTAADPTTTLLTRLATAVLHALSGHAGDAVAQLRDLSMEADLAALPWVERLARGLAEAVGVTPGSPSWRVAACLDIVHECDRAGDGWGAAILRLAAALAHQVTDEPEPDDFANAATRFQALDARLPALWAEALQACALTRLGDSEGRVLAKRVAADATSAHVPVLATFAAAVAGDAPRVDTGLPAQLRTLVPGSVVVAPTETSRHVDPTTVSVRCFGGFQIEIDGVPADLNGLRPRARAVLRMLAMTPQFDVHQEYLIEALWPGVPVSTALRRLQVAVSGVRHLLDELGISAADWLPRNGNAYRLVPDPASRLDVLVFTEELRRAAGSADRNERIRARTAALDAYTGDLLPEDGPADHVVVERERLRIAASAAAAALAEDLRAAGRLAEARAAAHRSVQLERYQDTGWELLAALHDDAGDLLAAERIRREQAKVQSEWVSGSF